MLFLIFPPREFRHECQTSRMPPRFPIDQKVGTEPGYHNSETLFLPPIYSAQKFIPLPGFRSLPLLPFPLIRSIAHKHFWHGEKGLFQTPISPTQFSWGQFTPFQGGSQSSLPPSSLYHYAFLIGSPDREKAPVFPIPFSRSPSPLPRILMRIQKSDGGRELFKRSDG